MLLRLEGEYWLLDNWWSWLLKSLSEIFNFPFELRLHRLDVRLDIRSPLIHANLELLELLPELLKISCGRSRFLRLLANIIEQLLAVVFRGR